MIMPLSVHGSAGAQLSLCCSVHTLSPSLSLSLCPRLSVSARAACLVAVVRAYIKAIEHIRQLQRMLRVH
jgi:hypothetical protein